MVSYTYDAYSTEPVPIQAQDMVCAVTFRHFADLGNTANPFDETVPILQFEFLRTVPERNECFLPV